MSIEALGERIRRARMRAGLSQTALARQVGITKNAMHRLEHGANEPRAAHLRAIAAALAVTTDYLLGLTPARVGE